MKKMSVKNKLVGMILLPAFFSGAVLANETSKPHEHDSNVPEAYSVNDDGSIWRSSPDLGGHCWRTGYWEPKNSIYACDTNTVKVEKEVVVKTPAPEPAPALAPAPEPVPVATPVSLEKFSFSADALFDFDSARLKPKGQTALLDFSRKLKRLNYDIIIVTGHTDRMGAEAYNKALSVRRAESVKAFLVSNGILSNHIFTEGKGESEPETGDSCQGGGQALKNCLAPDRRVEIEVAGTR